MLEPNVPTREPNLPAAAAHDSLIWYALYTRHQHEKVVASVLTGKGFEIFLPLYATAHRWKDRVKQLSLPLFPCYVFLRGPLDRWLPILTTPGVHSVVGSGAPGIIPGSEIEAIRRVVNSRVKAEPYPLIRCGDRVRIKAGSLQGLEGILIRKKDQWNLILSVEMLERSVAVEVDASMVERVSISKPMLTPRWLAATASAHM
jgi:transcription antitermination factor NusG